MILASIAIPYKPEKHEYELNGKSWKITSGSPCLIFYKELTKAKVTINPQVFVAVKYFDITNDGDFSSAAKQFVKEKLYGCKILITNTSGSNLNLSILLQIPEGSIPLVPPNYSKSRFQRIYNNSTDIFESIFYFPECGSFIHNPACIAEDGTIISNIEGQVINVLDKYDASKLESFNDLVISDRKDLILEYLIKENITSVKGDFSLEKIFWMMKNKEFWAKVINIYRSRFCFDKTLWSFAFLHNDKEVLSELFRVSRQLNGQVGYFFNSALLSTGSEDFKHLEFDPLVNARAYQLGNQERITNTRFKEVYKTYLYYLSEKSILENQDFLCLCQYFILQERHNEALEVYSRINMKPSSSTISSNELQIQYDYITCYLDLEKAKTIALLYNDYPVLTWNKYFKEISLLLKEIETEEIPQVVVSKKEPTLNFQVENNSIVLNYEGVQNCKVRIYEIDLEILFSNNPFLIKDTQSFSYVQANTEISIELSGNAHSVSLEEYKGKNILIEVDYKTYSISKSHFSNLLAFNCIERFGVIKVMDSNRKPRPAVYIKAFVKRKSGQIEFYKDGYTDIRGKFDYVSLNTDTLSTIDKFSLLVVDDELGSLVHEANPPPQ